MVGAPDTWAKCSALWAGREDSSRRGFQEEAAQAADGMERCVKGKELFWRTWRWGCVRPGRVLLDLCWGSTAPSPHSGHGTLFLTLSLMSRPRPETALLPATQELLPFQAGPCRGSRDGEVEVCTCVHACVPACVRL